MLILENKNILELVNQGAIGIPTNGYLGRNGAGVMGAGLALAAKDRYTGLAYSLGTHLRTNGNVVGWLSQKPHKIIAVPVKPVSVAIRSQSDMAVEVLPRVRHLYQIPSIVPGYHCKASLPLIEQSLLHLVDFIEKHSIDQVFLPLLGCGNGGLSPTRDLFPLLERLDLPDSMTLVTPPQE